MSRDQLPKGADEWAQIKARDVVAGIATGEGWQVKPRIQTALLDAMEYLLRHQMQDTPRPPTIHHLQCDPGPFQALWDGTKRVEIRFDDRGFRVGDELVVREGVGGHAMHRVVRRVVLHVQRGYGLRDGYVALSLEVPADIESKSLGVQFDLPSDTPTVQDLAAWKKDAAKLVDEMRALLGSIADNPEADQRIVITEGLRSASKPSDFWAKVPGGQPVRSVGLPAAHTPPTPDEIEAKLDAWKLVRYTGTNQEKIERLGWFQANGIRLSEVDGGILWSRA